MLDLGEERDVVVIRVFVRRNTEPTGAFITSQASRSLTWASTRARSFPALVVHQAALGLLDAYMEREGE